MPNIKNDLSADFLESLEYDTPFFVFSKKKILNKYKEFKKNFPDSTIFYAMKANAEKEVLELLNKAGSSFEVASIYELAMLKEIGVSPKRMLYGTSIKKTSHIKEFYDFGVEIYSFDCMSELEKIASVAPGVKVFLRVIVGDAGSVFKFSEKFGTNKENIVPLLKKAKELGLIPYGISFHVGSQASNPRAWANALKEIPEPMRHLKDAGVDIQITNLGGGFPCKYATTENYFNLSEIAKYTLKQFNELPYQPKLILEPGRGMIADTCVLVATVIGRVERSGNTWLFLDAGVYNALFEAMAYQGSTRYEITSMRTSYDAGEMMYEIAGPTGDSPDIITREALLPKDIEVGDKLIINKVGAYSLVVSNKLNGFPKPDVYYI